MDKFKEVIICEEKSFIEKAVTTGTKSFETIAENGAKLFLGRVKEAYNETEIRKIPAGNTESHQMIYLLWEVSIRSNPFLNQISTIVVYLYEGFSLECKAYIFRTKFESKDCQKNC